MIKTTSIIIKTTSIIIKTSCFLSIFLPFFLSVPPFSLFCLLDYFSLLPFFTSLSFSSFLLFSIRQIFFSFTLPTILLPFFYSTFTYLSTIIYIPPSLPSIDFHSFSLSLILSLTLRLSLFFPLCLIIISPNPSSLNE